MATASLSKKPCCKCNKGGGVFTCDGCQQSFCRKHVDEHRQELALQMDNIGQEHDIFQRDLNKEMDLHPLIVRIDEWEQESINKIQQVAQQTRDDLRKGIDQSKKDLKTSINQLANELQSSRDSDDYTEIDLKRWMDQLQALRNKLEKPLLLDVIDDDDDKRSVIRLIKVSEQVDSRLLNQMVRKVDQDQQVLHRLMSRNLERFEPANEEILLSKDRCTATCIVASSLFGITVRGTRYYSNGINQIRFRIEQKQSTCMFLGIETYHSETYRQDFAFTSINGWQAAGMEIKDGRSNSSLSPITMQTDDEITLVLDCDHRELRFVNHRTRQTSKMSIDLQKCPFPWQMRIILNVVGDSVRILDDNNSS